MAQVQFILGRSGTGKSRWCIDAVCGALASGGSDPLILLVPEQATYQVERAILSHPEISGFSRLMVLSFNRLAFRLAPLAASGAELSTAGKQMILHRLLLETADQLTVYKTPVATMGLAAKLTDLLSDLQHHNCSARQIALLAEQLAHKPGQMLAAKKWADIATVFAAYEACFADADNHFSNPDTELDAAKERAAAATFLDGARVWVDGFSGFSVQEQNLLAELLKRSSSASVALCLDPTQLDLSSNDESTLDPYSLFASAEQTYCQLLRLIRNCKLSLAEPVLLDTPWRFADAAPLAALEANLAADSPTEPVAANGAIRIEACATVRAETLRTAAHIRDLVKNHSYRYRQIAVVVPDMDGYRHYLESAFRQYDLPYFLDRPRQMKTHPLIELIGAALQAVGGNFRLSDILSYLKSPLTGTAGEQVDALENYCRAFDIQSPEWRQKAAWNFAGDQDKKTLKEDQMDALRRKVIAPLRQLQKALTDEPLIPVDSFIQALWQLLETLSVRNMMADWAAEDPADQHGHRQVFSRLLEITDEMAAIFDGVEMAPQAWMSILTDVLSSAAIKLIPPSLDQVLVGSIERSRHPDIKAVFLIGVAQKQFPVPTMSEKLLTEQDYQSAADLQLANPYDQHLTHRPYLSYIALTRASHRLYLSYPLTDEKGGQVVRWSGIDRLAALFTDVAVEFIETAPAPETIETHPQLARWLCEKLGADNPHPDSTASVAAGVLEQIAAGDNTLKQTAAKVRASLDYDNAAVLNSQTADAIFQFPLTTSNSQLGTFAKCPYQYFAKYTLGLKPRQMLRFEPMDVGRFYHAVLEAVFNALKRQNTDWADLSADELIALSDAESERIIGEDAELINFMRRRTHHKYIIQSARDVLRRFVPMLAQLSAAGRFKQDAAEMRFGFDQSFRLVLPLDNDRDIHLRGLIDRLDTAEIAGKQAAIVFDYKTGGKSVDFAGIFYGLDLQLPIYLLAVREKNLTPAGAFFLPIKTGTDAADASGIDAAEASFDKAKGLFDGSFFEALDTHAGGGWSAYYNFFVNKDGDPYSHYKNSGALKPDDFAALLDHTERRIKQLVTDLTAGCIRITPFRKGTESPCTWCDYRPLCRFDWQINNYNILNNIGKEEVLEKMKGH